MNISLNEFQRKKEFLICVDSDGCAMDTMDSKHIRCFGPCLVEEWGLDQWRETILSRWNEINLYTKTRGINRFLGLAMALREIDGSLCPIEGAGEFEDWARRQTQLSNDSVKKKAECSPNPCFSKALSWSRKVNALIGLIPEEDKKPFTGVKEGLAAAHVFADVAIVSSANREAVMEEWRRWGLLEYVDLLCCQDAGSKAHVIGTLKTHGYPPGRILMVGDAPGDRAAAAANDVWFYPILVKREEESWRELLENGLRMLRNQDYGDYGVRMAQRFLKNLE